MLQFLSIMYSDSIFYEIFRLIESIQIEIRCCDFILAVRFDPSKTQLLSTSPIILFYNNSVATVQFATN